MGPTLTASTVVRLGWGLAILVGGGLVRSRGRLDLLANVNPDDTTDREGRDRHGNARARRRRGRPLRALRTVRRFSTAALSPCLRLLVASCAAVAVARSG
ncbi:hypothetical protein [Halalkalicoccus salilacus]|uniref:hypothetical protein n=1 Tax=Halalkalicoccus salilacus TaxID=3117459 RepID=UPI00300F68C3